MSDENSKSIIYTIKYGDMLGRLSGMFGFGAKGYEDWTYIGQNIESWNDIQAGVKAKIPAVEYTIRDGDSLERIVEALNFETRFFASDYSDRDPKELLQSVNPGKDFSKVGERVLLPEQLYYNNEGTINKALTVWTKHTVAQGDSFSTIALKYGYKRSDYGGGWGRYMQALDELKDEHNKRIDELKQQHQIDPESVEYNSRFDRKITDIGKIGILWNIYIKPKQDNVAETQQNTINRHNNDVVSRVNEAVEQFNEYSDAIEEIDNSHINNHSNHNQSHDSQEVEVNEALEDSKNRNKIIYSGVDYHHVLDGKLTAEELDTFIALVLPVTEGSDDPIAGTISFATTLNSGGSFGKIQADIRTNTKGRNCFKVIAQAALSQSSMEVLQRYEVEHYITRYVHAKEPEDRRQALNQTEFGWIENIKNAQSFEVLNRDAVVSSMVEAASVRQQHRRYFVNDITPAIVKIDGEEITLSKRFTVFLVENYMQSPVGKSLFHEFFAKDYFPKLLRDVKEAVDAVGSNEINPLLVTHFTSMRNRTGGLDGTIAWINDQKNQGKEITPESYINKISSYRMFRNRTSFTNSLERLAKAASRAFSDIKFVKFNSDQMAYISPGNSTKQALAQGLASIGIDAANQDLKTYIHPHMIHRQNGSSIRLGATVLLPKNQSNQVTTAQLNLGLLNRQ